MLLVQFLLRAMSLSVRPRLRLAMLPAAALMGAIGAASAASVAGAHPLHTTLSAAVQLLASGDLAGGGGPTNP